MLSLEGECMLNSVTLHFVSLSLVLKMTCFHDNANPPCYVIPFLYQLVCSHSYIFLFHSSHLWNYCSFISCMWVGVILSPFLTSRLDLLNCSISSSALLRLSVILSLSLSFFSRSHMPDCSILPRPSMSGCSFFSHITSPLFLHSVFFAPFISVFAALINIID